MKYNLYFNYLRNIGYVFKFNREFQKVYDLYFKYIPVYEIFIHALKDVEISRQADKIKPASFLYNFINILNVKNKKIDEILLEILKDHTPNKDLSRLLDFEKQEIINISQQFVKDVDILKKARLSEFNNENINILRESNNPDQILHLGTPQEKDVNVNSKKFIDLPVKDIYTINKEYIESSIMEQFLISAKKLETDSNIDTVNFNKMRTACDFLLSEISRIFKLKPLEAGYRGRELIQHPIKNVDLVKKGKIIEDASVSINREMLINNSITTEIEDIICTHFFSKTLAIYYKEIKTALKYEMEIYGNELNTLYKNHLYDMVYDLFYFINHKDIEFDGNMVKKLQFHTYSILESDIIFFKTITSELNLIEVGNKYYCQVDFSKKGKIVSDKYINLQNELSINNPCNVLSSGKEISIYVTQNIDNSSENILNNYIKQIDTPSEDVLREQIKYSETSNIDVSSNFSKQIDAPSENVLSILSEQIEIIDSNVLNFPLKPIENPSQDIRHNSLKQASADNITIINNQFIIVDTSSIDSYSKDCININTLDLESYTKNLLYWIDSYYEGKRHKYQATTISTKKGKIFEDDGINTQREINKCSFFSAELSNITATTSKISNLSLIGFNIINIDPIKNIGSYSNEIIIIDLSTIDNSIEEAVNYGNTNIYIEGLAKMFDGYDKTPINKSLAEIIIDNSSSKGVSADNNDSIVNHIGSAENFNKIFEDYHKESIPSLFAEANISNPIYASVDYKIFDDYKNITTFASSFEIINHDLISTSTISKSFDNYNDTIISFNINELQKIGIGTTIKDSKQFNNYNNDYCHSQTTNIFIENLIYAEKFIKDFFDFDSNWLTNQTQDVLIINVKETEKTFFNFNDYTERSTNVTDINISSVYSNILLEEGNKQFNIYDDDFLITNINEYINIPIISVELLQRNLDDHNYNKVHMNNYDIHTLEVDLIEKFSQHFFEIDIQNPEITKLDINEHKFLIIDTGKNEFIVSLDDEYMNISLEDIFNSIQSLVEPTSNIFEDYSNKETTISKDTTSIKKSTLIEKLNNQFDEFFVEWGTISPSALNRIDAKLLENKDKQLTDCETSSVNLEYDEIIIERLPYLAESVSRIFDHYIDTQSNLEAADLRGVHQTILLKKEKELEYNEIENVILDSSEILFPGVKIIDIAQKIFNNYNEEHIDSPQVDTIVASSRQIEKQNNQLEDFNAYDTLTKSYDLNGFSITSVEKNNKQLDNFDMNTTPTENYDIKNITTILTEKSYKQLDDMDIDNIFIRKYDANKFISSLAEIRDKQFDNYKIKDLIHGFSENSKWIVKHLDKINKLFDDYDFDLLNPTVVEIVQMNSASAEKYQKILVEYDVNNLNTQKINTKAKKLMLVEKSNKILDLFGNEDFQSMLGLEIITLFDKNVEQYSKTFDDFYISSLNENSIDISYVDLQWVEKDSKILNEYVLIDSDLNEIVIDKNRILFIENSINQFSDYHIEHIIVSSTGVNKNYIQSTELNNRKFDEYNTLTTNSISLEVAQEGLLLSTENVFKKFDDYLEVEINIDKNETSISKQISLIRRQQEFNDDVNKDVLSYNTEILVLDPRMLGALQKNFDNYQDTHLDPPMIDINISVNEYIEKQSNRLDNYDIHNLPSFGTDIYEPNLSFIEKNYKLLDIHDSDNFKYQDTPIDCHSNILVEKHNKLFDLIEEDHYISSKSEIKFITIAALENTSKRLDNFDFGLKNSSALEIIGSYIEWTEKKDEEFNSYYEDYVNSWKEILLYPKINGVDKIDNQLDDYDIKLSTLSSSDLKKWNNQYIEKSDRLFNDYDIKDIIISSFDLQNWSSQYTEKDNRQLDDCESKEIIISPMEKQKNNNKYVEKNVRQLDNYDSDLHNSREMNIMVEHFIDFVEPFSKTLESFIEVEINIDQIELEESSNKFIIEKDKEFESYDTNNLNFNNTDIALLNVSTIETIQKRLGEYSEKDLDNVIIDIDINSIDYVEKHSRLLDNFNDNDISAIEENIENLHVKLIEKNGKSFDDFDMKNLISDANEINLYILNSLEKVNKRLDEYITNNSTLIGIDISKESLELVEKFQKMLNDYDTSDLDNKNIDINDYEMIWIEKNDKILDSFLDEYQSNLGYEINIELDDKVEKSRKEFYSIDFNSTNNSDLQIISFDQSEVEKSKREFDNYDDKYISTGNVYIESHEPEWIEKQRKEFSDFYLKHLQNSDFSISTSKNPDWIEKIRKEFDNFINNAVNLQIADIDSNLFDNLEKLRKEFNNYSDKSVSSGQMLVNSFNLEDLEKEKKELYDFINRQLNNGTYNLLLYDSNGTEKKNKELNVYDLGQGGRGGIDIHTNAPTPPDIGWLTKKEKELDEFNDNHLHRAVEEIAYSISGGETNPNRMLETILLEIIGPHDVKSRSNLSVEEVFFDIVSDSHKKFFDASFSESLSKMYHSHCEIFLNEVTKNKYKILQNFETEVVTNAYKNINPTEIGISKHSQKGVERFGILGWRNKSNGIELPKDEIFKIRNKHIELKLISILNKLIAYTKAIEFEKIEGKRLTPSLINNTQQEAWQQSISSINKMQLFINKVPKFAGVTKKSIETWKSFKDAIISNKQILKINRYDAEENEQKSEINDMIDNVLDWVNTGKLEAVIHAMTFGEQDGFSDEIEDDNIIDFVNTGKQEIVQHRNKNHEQYGNVDEINDLDGIDFVTYGKLEVDLHSVRGPVDETFNSEIEENNPIVHVTREKIEALTYTQKLINKMQLDTGSRNLQKGIDLLPKTVDRNKLNWIELNNSREAKINHLSGVEMKGINEIWNVNPKGAETGKRGFNPKLEDWWSQDWIFLTEYKTPLAELIELREEAVRDFKNFMERCIIYKDPIKGEELDELVYRWSVNTDYNAEYVNEIEHFYYLVHTKIGKNNYYAKGQLELITNIIIENYKKFYINEFKKYQSELIKPNEEVRIRLRAMLHFYMFLEQLIDANQGYLKVCTVQEGIDLLKKILRGWIESETSHFEPTEDELEQLDPWIANQIRENLPEDYVYLVRWFEWYCKEEEFIYGHNFTKDGFTAVSNIRDKMISYFNTHWGVRRTNYMDELDKVQLEIENAQELLDNGIDPQGQKIAAAMMKAVNLVKPSVLVDTSVVDKLRGMMHGKVNRINKKFNINGLGSIQRSSLVGWRGMNKHDKNKTNTWTNQGGERYANLKDSYNIDQHSLTSNPNYNTMIYNIAKLEKIEE